MTLDQAFSATRYLLCFVLLIQGLEMFLCTRRPGFFEIWSYENLSSDLERGLPLPRSLVRLLFADRVFPIICVLQILLAIGGFVQSHLALFASLFLTQLLICIRFRGTFNGGSDMMAFVVLTGLLIALAKPDDAFARLGLMYICIHTLYSYFKSGFSKIRQRDWRKGRALPAFLDRSLFSDMRLLANWLQAQRISCGGLCWLILVFELLAISLPFAPRFAPWYFAAVMLFHLGNFVAFGLNRFFWIWLCAWPAVLYSVHAVA